MDEFKLDAANDNYDKSIKTFARYEEVAEALTEMLSDCFGDAQQMTIQESIQSAIHRTNSIPALLQLVQRVDGMSFTKLVSAYVDELLKPVSSNESQRTYSHVALAACIQGVLSDTMTHFLRGSDVSTIPPEYVEWRIPVKNYLDPRHMKEDVRKFRGVVFSHASQFENVLELVKQEAIERLALLRSVQR